MHCPSCRTQLSVPQDHEDSVTTCARCGGAWYVGQALRLTKDAADADLNWLDFQLWKDWDSLELEPTDRPCPGCDRALVEVRYAETSVRIDCCPICEGIWLDPGEFETIVAELNSEALSRPFPEYVTASLKEAREIIAGPESLGSEWRDFTTVLRLLQYRVLSDHPRASRILAEIQSAGRALT
jgi:Zn-finger nucleic acid-binding protein